MEFQAFFKTNSRFISDACAGSDDYFNLATTNLSLYRALRTAAREHVRGRLLDAGAGRMPYRRMLMEFCKSYESLDAADGTGTDHVADLQATGLPSCGYDSVFCTQVLQHLPEPARAINELARLLKPGGRVVFSVPHLVWLHNEPHDYWRFTGHGMRYLLECAGLRVLGEKKIGGLVCFLAYVPSTIALALFWPIRPLFRMGLLLNKLLVRLALLADCFFGAKSLFPTNYVIVAEKPAT